MSVYRTFLLSFSVLILALPILSQDYDWQNKVDTEILNALRTDRKADCLILLAEQTKINALPYRMTKAQKGDYVFQKLIAKAEATQPPLIASLKAARIPYRSFWLINAVWAQMDEDQLAGIATRRDVFRIVYDPWVKMQLPESTTMAATRNAIEWGVQQIGADQVWENGFNGQGTVIGGQDTGYDWTHPALKDTYRGWDGQNADHSYNWHDAIHELNPLHQDSMPGPDTNPCGLDVKSPCDDGDHGTHTMGTMVGDDGMGNQIGVAPGAQWIGCRNMDRGYGKPSTYLECFQWFLAPTDLNGENPDPLMAPHVINNSWSCPEMEGCNASNFDILQAAIHNLRTAGVVVVVSAGNNGSGGCGSVNAPPSIFAESFAVGATNGVDTLANFSSLGPVTVDSSFRAKPDVSAPGVWVRSCVPGNGYGHKSGTSMAGPHVAGAVALLISTRPQIAGDVDSIEALLQQTAEPAWPGNFALNNFDCNNFDEFPNLYVGSGRINVHRAFKQLTTISHVVEPGNVPAFWIDPNPFVSTINIEISNDEPGTWSAELSNATGQMIWSRSDIQSGERLKVNLSFISSGMYQLKFSNGRQVHTKSLVKQ